MSHWSYSNLLVRFHVTTISILFAPAEKVFHHRVLGYFGVTTRLVRPTDGDERQNINSTPVRRRMLKFVLIIAGKAIPKYRIQVPHGSYSTNQPHEIPRLQNFKSDLAFELFDFTTVNSNTAGTWESMRFSNPVRHAARSRYRVLTDFICTLIRYWRNIIWPRLHAKIESFFYEIIAPELRSTMKMGHSTDDSRLELSVIAEFHSTSDFIWNRPSPENHKPGTEFLLQKLAVV
jgi:hypothetical protein